MSQWEIQCNYEKGVIKLSKNIIFYFSGTGNCLKLSKDIAKELPDCEIVSMAKHESYTLNGEYECVGFVYPTYFSGIPIKVNRFLSNFNFPENKVPYIFVIASCGAFAGNALAQVSDLLKQRGQKPDYGNKIKMVSNYVIAYDVGKNVDKKTKKSDAATLSIIEDIQMKKIKPIGRINSLLRMYYNRQVKIIPTTDKDYTVSDDCVSCAICKEICPVNNIELTAGKPVFKHYCEQCMACIQYCPNRAINYKNKTQKRGRYTNPDVSYKELNK